MDCVPVPSLPLSDSLRARPGMSRASSAQAAAAAVPVRRNTTLFVDGLAESFASGDLTALFAQYGQVVEGEVFVDNDNVSRLRLRDDAQHGGGGAGEGGAGPEDPAWRLARPALEGALGPGQGHALRG